MPLLSRSGRPEGKTFDKSCERLLLNLGTLQEIPERFPDIDLLLIHLGGTTIPGPHAPLLMVVSPAGERPDTVRFR